MLKASALYIVIIISLVIAVLCSSLIVTTYYYRAEYQKKFRYDQLQNNLGSAINIIISTSDSAYQNEKVFRLVNQDNDSISLQKKGWGVYTVGIAKAFIQKDTLYKTFMLANTIDSSKWEALYLLNEDKPVAVSGKTKIQGDVHLPKAGVIYTFIDNQGYEGDKRLVIGKQYISDKKLPPLDTVLLNQLSHYFSAKGDSIPNTDSIARSFLQATKIYDFGKRSETLSHVFMNGNIILHSDTTITIDSTVKLDNILVFAKSIIINSGFRGRCQIFASDSISVAKNCRFEYPSCLGIIRGEKPNVNSQAKISMGKKATLNGLIFTYEKEPNDLKPLISVGKNDTIKGQIYSQETLEFKGHDVINGNIITSRFLYQVAFNNYENYLVNVTVNSQALSAYYLTSGLLPTATKKKKILQWLEGN